MKRIDWVEVGASMMILGYGVFALGAAIATVIWMFKELFA